MQLILQQFVPTPNPPGPLRHSQHPIHGEFYGDHLQKIGTNSKVFLRLAAFIIRVKVATLCFAVLRFLETISTRSQDGCSSDKN